MKRDHEQGEGQRTDRWRDSKWVGRGGGKGGIGRPEEAKRECVQKEDEGDGDEERESMQEVEDEEGGEEAHKEADVVNGGSGKL